MQTKTTTKQALKIKTESQRTITHDIILNNVSFSYGQTSVLNNVSLSAQKGKTHFIIGQSGVGKTTFLKIINGLLSPNQGDVSLFGTKLNEKNIKVLRTKVGYIPQDMGLVSNLSAKDNVLLGALHRTKTLSSFFNIFSKKEKQHAYELLDILGIADHAEKKIYKLSGGQKRRVAIARALIQKPKILLADEILSDIDFVQAENIMNTLTSIQKDISLTVLMVEHDLCITRQCADSISIMKQGSILDNVDVAEALGPNVCGHFK